jgi:hypothetical protein
MRKLEQGKDEFFVFNGEAKYVFLQKYLHSVFEKLSLSQFSLTTDDTCWKSPVESEEYNLQINLSQIVL